MNLNKHRDRMVFGKASRTLMIKFIGVYIQSYVVSSLSSLPRRPRHCEPDHLLSVARRGAGRRTQNRK